MKNGIIIGLAAIVLLLAAKTYILQTELNEYKNKYDGLQVFEDGTWSFKDGQYYEFWNDNK